MADSKQVSNRGSSKRKKKSSQARKVDPFNGDLSDQDDEPPLKRLKYEFDRRQPLSISAHVTTDGDHVIKTPSKSSEPESFLSRTTIKSVESILSPDSAYNSAAEKSPWPFLRPLSSVTSSGIGTDWSDCWTPIRNEIKDQQQHSFNEDQESGRLFNFLHINFTMLKEEMDPIGIADHLYNDGIITKTNRETIADEKHRARRCDALIKAIAASNNIRKRNTEWKLRKAFDAEKCLFLLNDLGKDRKILSPNVKFEKMEILTKLRLHGKEIDDGLEPKHVIDDLVSLGMLTLVEHDDILETVTKKNRVHCLMDYLMKDPETNFPMFCEAVDKKYPDLGKKLLQKDNITDENEPKSKLHVKVKVQSSTWLPRNGVGEGEKTFVKFNMKDHKDLERMIVDEYNIDPTPRLEEEAMEVGFSEDGVQFSSIKINLTQLSRLAQLRLYKKCKESPEFLEAWLQGILPQDKLKEMQQRRISSLQFEIHLQKPSTVLCVCKLTKENIVKHFSHIEKSLKEVDRILHVFANFPQFDEETKSMFEEMRLTDARRVETFLRKILEIEEDAVVCLLQRELINTDQQALLNSITKKKLDVDCKSIAYNGRMRQFMILDSKGITTWKRDLVDPRGKVSVKAFRKCFSFLQDEIEPRKFIGTLVKIPGNEEVSEFVMSSEPRRQRCRKFLEFIHKEGQTAIDHFVLALEAENKKYILDELTTVDHKDQNNEKDVERLKDSILAKFNEIVSEVDTRFLRHVFIERKVMKAKEYDGVCKHTARKTRVISLLKHILEKDGFALACFMHALETEGYEKLAAEISKEKESYKPCPRLDMADGEVVVFKGSCELIFTTESEKESPFQLELHKRIYGNERIDKDSYTRRWLAQVSPEPMLLHGCRKRRHSQDDEEFVVPKRLFTESDRDSGIYSSSSLHEPCLKTIDEASDKYSQTQEDRSSQSLSLPTSPSTTLTLYEPISPPASPVSEPSTINSFVPGNYYLTAMSIEEVNRPNTMTSYHSVLSSSRVESSQTLRGQGRGLVKGWETSVCYTGSQCNHLCFMDEGTMSNLPRSSNSRSMSIPASFYKQSAAGKSRTACQNFK